MRSPRLIVVLLACCAFVFARLLGLHMHVAPDAHEHAVAAIESHLLADHERSHVASDLDTDHSGAQQAHSDVDVDAPDTAGGKLPSLPLLALIAAALALLLVPPPRRLSAPLHSRVPIPRRRHHLLPPSQAPPHAS